MQANLCVFRFNPKTDSEPRYQSYRVADLPDYATVLDALIRVREEQDGTLTFRCSCRSAVCGSCAMRINGHAALACKTKLVDIAPKGEEILVEPMGNMAVVKDLVVDMKMFWDKVRAVQPWVTPERLPADGREFHAEHGVTKERMEELQQPMNCIMCGACVSDCTVIEAELKAGKPVERTFLGPAALAKAYRVVGDPRDSKTKERLGELVKQTGVWDCTHCFECVQVCPKDVAPMEQILKLRKLAVEAGYTDSNGFRHAEAAVEFIRHSGWLDELRYIPKTYQLPPYGFNIAEAIRQTPSALRMALKGKLPPVIHKPIPGIEGIRRLFEKLEGSGG